MLATILAMLVILGIAGVVVGMVVVGMEGAGRHRLPEVAKSLAQAGRHLNGDAEPPKGLVAFFEEAESGATELRQLPATIRQRRAESAKSARSAKSASTARSASSPASVDPVEATEAPRRASAWETPVTTEPAAGPASSEPASQPVSAWATWSNDRV